MDGGGRDGGTAATGGLSIFGGGSWGSTSATGDLRFWDGSSWGSTTAATVSLSMGCGGGVGQGVGDLNPATGGLRSGSFSRSGGGTSEVEDTFVLAEPKESPFVGDCEDGVWHLPLSLAQCCNIQS